MATAYVLNSEARQVELARTGQPLPDGRTQIITLNFLPGGNEVSAAELEIMRQQPSNERFFKAGILKLHVPEVSTPDDDVMAAIANCEDPRQLRRWMDTRGHREDWRAALIRRHNELTTGSGDSAAADESEWAHG
jgi:hypothetical protein